MGKSAPVASKTSSAASSEPQEHLIYRLLRSNRIRQSLCAVLSSDALCSLRGTSQVCCKALTPHLFRRLHITFTASSFTKQARLLALARIGHHVEQMVFYIPHSAGTFLPPLIHRSDGHEIGFLYSPHTSVDSPAARPKYTNLQFAELLTQQYPPLFHAATNTPSFIQAFRCLSNLRRLSIRCPGQDSRERYRRSIVDYALISLRVALERAPLHQLYSLSLDPVHPAALHYLRHVPAFGPSPAAARRWRQIRSLRLAVDSWDFHGPHPGHDNLCIIDDFVRALAPNIEKLSYEWIGRRGPCPVALAGDSGFVSTASVTAGTPAAFSNSGHPVLSQAVDGGLATAAATATATTANSKPSTSPRRPIHLPRLRYLLICNSSMNVPQVSDLVAAHRSTVKTFDFQHIELLGPGTLEDALAPLNRPSSSSSISGPVSCGQPNLDNRVIDTTSWSQLPLDHRNTSTAGLDRGQRLSSPSIASHGLLFIGVDPSLGLDLDTNTLESGIRESGQALDVGMQNDTVVDTDDAIIQQRLPHTGNRDSGVAFSTRVTRYHPDHRTSRERDDRVMFQDPSQRNVGDADHRRKNGSYKMDENHRSQENHHQNQKDDRMKDELREPPHRSDLQDNQTPSKRQRSRRELNQYGSSDSNSSSSTADRKPETLASSPPSPSRHKSGRSDGSKSSNLCRPGSGHDSSPRPTRATPSDPGKTITPPLMPPQHPQLTVLQPTVYHRGQPAAPCSRQGLFTADAGISPVQRNIEKEAAQRLLAEDPELRTSALRKAKEAVLSKMAQELRKRERQRGRGRENTRDHDDGQLKPLAESGPGSGPGGASSFTYSARFREQLFAKSTITVLPDRCVLESQSALVPLMFTRSLHLMPAL